MPIGSFCNMRALTFATSLLLLSTEVVGTNKLALGPLHIDEYNAAVGLSRRSIEFSDLRPKAQTKLWYGHPANENGTMVAASVVFNAPSNLPIVSVEHFESFLRRIDCEKSTGQVSFTFKYKKAFEEALKAWTFVNNGVENEFLLLANHDGCGSDQDRHPYV